MKRIFLIVLLLFTFSLCAQNNSLIENNAEPLPIDQAFKFSGTARDTQTIIARWQIAPGYYLYKDHMHFKVIKPASARLGMPLFPPGIEKEVPELGKFEIFQNFISIPIPILQTKNKQILLQVSYQGCSEQGYCYPPVTKSLLVNLAGNYMHPINGTTVTNELKPTTPGTLQDRAEKLLAKNNLFLVILGFFGFGILLSLTPCMLPMVPILSSIIAGQGKISTLHSFCLSLAYVLGMAIAYAAAGILFGLLGANIQAILQKPWIILAFSLFFVILSLSLFGFYTLQLPEKWRSALAAATNRQKGGTYIGAFMMGLLSSLILSPCVTPPLVGILSYIGHQGNALLGGSALFVTALGMGFPLLILGVAHGKFLPKSGAWMNAIENILGVFMLGLAILMLSRILAPALIMVFWSALAIGVSIYLGALATPQTNWERTKKGIGIVLFIYSIILLIGAMQGNINPLKPLRFARATVDEQIAFKPVKNVDDAVQELANARRDQKPVILDFYADWCLSCKIINHFVFSNPLIKDHLSSFNLLRANVTANDAEDKLLEKHFNVIAPPTIIFFDANGNEIPDSRIVGEVSAPKFLRHIRKLGY